MLTPSRQAALRRELVAAQHICYSAHVAANVVRTTHGDYLQVFRLAGVGFETADDAQLNSWHERLNALWRDIASPNLALWTTLIRRRAELPAGHGDGLGGDFASDLAARYRRRMADEALMQNDLYLAVLHRPTHGMATGLVSRLLRRTPRDGAERAVLEDLEVCDKLAQTIVAGLTACGPERLGSYALDGRWYSSLLEYLGLLINSEWQRIPLPLAPLSGALATSRVFFGTEAIEYRTATATRVGAMLGIKEYPTPSLVGMYNRLLATHFPLILTQSFSYLSRAAGQGLLQRQAYRMSNAGDYAVSQAEDLKTALDALSSNEFAMGEHHFTLQVLAEPSESGQSGAAAPASQRLRALNDAVSVARALLAETGMTVAREDLALEAAFWAQLPGNFPMRPRKAPITTRNFAAMMPFHNYPLGRPHGNHWGEAMALLMTSARSPFHFSLHASDPREADGGSRKDTGHTFICGPTGSGKTVFIGFMVAMLSRQGTTQVIFDKDRGLEILVRALGGEYLSLRNARPTGFNPLQLPGTPEHVEFLRGWLQLLVRPAGGGELAVREQSDLEQALRAVLALQPDARRLSRLIEYLDITDPAGVHARLAPWCAVTRGPLAWVFDNPQDSVLGRMAGHSLIGFDVTEFLNHGQARAPVTAYLFHLVRQLLDGRRMVCWVDEFWRMLADPAFESFAKEAPKSWRKMNGVMCLATQSASDVLDSPISRTVIEQTATKIYFPNADASAEEYVDGLGLTGREFKLVKEQLVPGSRRFLLKQGTQSVVCQLDLRGFDAELSVISGRAEQLARLERILERCGNEPRSWLPEFRTATPA